MAKWNGSGSSSPYLNPSPWKFGLFGVKHSRPLSKPLAKGAQAMGEVSFISKNDDILATKRGLNVQLLRHLLLLIGMCTPRPVGICLPDCKPLKRATSFEEWLTSQTS